MILTAHSGSDGLPENSRVFIKAMLHASIPCVEIDVRITDEGHLYLNHDKTDWAHTLLSLDDAFSIIATNPYCKVNCDLKEPYLEGNVYSLAKKHNLEKRIIFSGTVDLKALPAEIIRDHVFYNVEQFLPGLYLKKEITDFEIATLVAFCQTNDIQTININYHLATDHFIHSIHESGLALSLWTVNEISEIERFQALGINHITTRQALAYQAKRQEVSAH